MAITRDKKEKFVSAYTEHARKSEAVIITANQGLKVSELQELRRRVREANGKFFIVKNTLASRSLAEANFPNVDNLLTGAVGIGFCHDNISGVAKAILDYAKQNERLVIKGGIIGKQRLDENGVKSLATLPTLVEIRGQLVGLITTPASQLVGVLSGGVRQLVDVLHAYTEKDKQTA